MENKKTVASHKVYPSQKLSGYSLKEAGAAPLTEQDTASFLRGTLKMSIKQ